MSFITEQLCKKHVYIPMLDIYEGTPKDEKTECKNVILKLKKENKIYFTILFFILVVAAIFVALAFLVPKDVKGLWCVISFPICLICIIVFSIFTYNTTKKSVKRIKLAKVNSVFIKGMKCTGKDIHDGDENKLYFVQFNNDLICKTNVKSFDKIRNGDTCQLVFIKGCSDFSVLGYVKNSTNGDDNI